MFVLITVPHSFCLVPPPAKRMCDTRALASAKIMASLLKKKEIAHTIISSHTEREMVDLNRDKPTNKNEKKWHKFDDRIKQAIKTHKKEEIILLDIHSFPHGNFNDAQIAIIDIFHKDRPELHQFVAQARRDLKLNVQLFKGGKNHIQDTYQKKTYPLLIEFCEEEAYLSRAEIKAFFSELVRYFF